MFTIKKLTWYSQNTSLQKNKKDWSHQIKAKKARYAVQSIEMVVKNVQNCNEINLQLSKQIKLRIFWI